MKLPILLAGAVIVALAGSVSSKEKKSESAPCPILVPGAEVSVMLIPTGAVIHVESDDPAILVKIYAAARAETPAHEHKKAKTKGNGENR